MDSTSSSKDNSGSICLLLFLPGFSDKIGFSSNFSTLRKTTYQSVLFNFYEYFCSLEMAQLLTFFHSIFSPSHPHMNLYSNFFMLCVTHIWNCCSLCMSSRCFVLKFDMCNTLHWLSLKDSFWKNRCLCLFCSMDMFCSISKSVISVPS